MKYSYCVSVGNGKGNRDLYPRGYDAAEAMAIWSKAITDGQEYAVLEALREETPCKAHPDDCPNGPGPHEYVADNDVTLPCCVRPGEIRRPRPLPPR